MSSRTGCASTGTTSRRDAVRVLRTGTVKPDVSHQQRIADAFVSLADPFEDGLDPLVLADRLVGHCVRLAGADGAGLMMVTARGRLRPVAASDDRAELLELLQAQTGEGPCAESRRTRLRVDVEDLRDHVDRWPHFAPLALDYGFRSAHGLPVRLHGEQVGALNLLRTVAGPLEEEALALAGALADVAAVGMALWRSAPVRQHDIKSRMQSVVAGRIAVETAQGMLAAAGGLDMSEASAALRAYCVRTGSSPTRTAYALVNRSLPVQGVLAPQGAQP
jgi:GAF domain-containing protein